MVMTQETKLELQRFALQIRIGILEQLKARGFGHIGGSLSIADTLAVLYGCVMRVDAADPKYARGTSLSVPKVMPVRPFMRRWHSKGSFPMKS